MSQRWGTTPAAILGITDPSRAMLLNIEILQTSVLRDKEQSNMTAQGEIGQRRAKFQNQELWEQLKREAANERSKRQ
jgi:hypothetical protein